VPSAVAEIGSKVLRSTPAGRPIDWASRSSASDWLAPEAISTATTVVRGLTTVEPGAASMRETAGRPVKESLQVDSPTGRKRREGLSAVGVCLEMVRERLRG
jgi:hypothetical protein